MMTDQKNGLPRLGSAEAGKPDKHTQVVVIPDRGVSVVLRKPSVGMIVEAQSELDLDTEDVEKSYLSTVNLVARMLVEPTMSAEDLKAEVDEWTFSDWQTLQAAALEMAGLREEDAVETRDAFRPKR